MKIKLWNTEVYITLWFSAVITTLLLFDRTGFILPMIFSVFVHETAHLLSMTVKGCAPKEIVLIPGSIQIVSCKTPSIRIDNIILFAGPLANLIFAVMFFAFYNLKTNKTVLVYALIQMIIGLFNLLPARGLDGGSIIYNICLLKRNSYFADLILQISSICVVIFFIFIGVWLLFHGRGNPSFFIMAVYIFILTILKYS